LQPGLKSAGARFRKIGESLGHLLFKSIKCAVGDDHRWRAGRRRSFVFLFFWRCGPIGIRGMRYLVHQVPGGIKCFATFAAGQQPGLRIQLLGGHRSRAIAVTTTRLECGDMNGRHKGREIVTDVARLRQPTPPERTHRDCTVRTPHTPDRPGRSECRSVSMCRPARRRDRAHPTAREWCPQGYSR
jgi:hypothetical protein